MTLLPSGVLGVCTNQEFLYSFTVGSGPSAGETISWTVDLCCSSPTSCCIPSSGVLGQGAIDMYLANQLMDTDTGVPVGPGGFPSSDLSHVGDGCPSALFDPSTEAPPSMVWYNEITKRTVGPSGSPSGAVPGAMEEFLTVVNNNQLALGTTIPSGGMTLRDVASSAKGSPVKDEDLARIFGTRNSGLVSGSGSFTSLIAPTE